MSESRVLIIGGGAAGLSAAVASARLGARVTLLERDARVGRKILASGNGRCNLTNLAISPHAYNCPEFVEPVLSDFDCDRIRVFFGEMGLLTLSDDEGRVYPATNTAASVLDVLRLECAHVGVDVRCSVEVERIVRRTGGSGFEVVVAGGERVTGECVVVATGVGPVLSDAGHAWVDSSPVLGPIRTDSEPIRGLSGVRVRCAATLLADGEGGASEAVATERGELLFRDYGVSGIMIFDLSRYLRKRCTISIDFAPDLTPQDLRTLLSERRAALPWRTAETFFAGMLHDRVGKAVLRVARVAPGVGVEDLPLDTLTEVLKDLRLRVLGMGDPKQAQVTRGGASVADFDARTMASCRVEGLLAAGEALDVDGRSGGYNLHWAWASGIVAGESAARIGSALVDAREAAPREPA